MNVLTSLTNFACRANLHRTEERVEAFLALDPSVRTFKLRVKDSEEDASTSYTMSSAQKSANKSASKFGPDDIDSMLSPHSIKKELAKGPSLLEPSAVTTREKAGSKRKKLVKPEGSAIDVERQLHESVTEGFVRVKAYYERSLAEMEENRKR
ncbi:hypothetical protein Hanom_Chr17g01535581 [Helianthus anomalus]